MKKRFIALICIFIFLMSACNNIESENKGALFTEENKTDERASESSTDVKTSSAEEDTSLPAEVESLIEDILPQISKITDLYGEYEPKPEVINCTCMEAPIIQIGDNLLIIGKSKVQDFVDAGLDLYWEGTPHNPETNESYWKISNRNPKVVQMYLEGLILFDLMTFYNDGTEAHLDDIVTGVTMEFNHIMVGGYVGTRNDIEIPYINSIYLPGGCAFSQTFSIAESFGTPYSEKEGSDPVSFHTRFYENLHRPSSNITPENPRYHFMYHTVEERVCSCDFAIQIR